MFNKLSFRQKERFLCDVQRTGGVRFADAKPGDIIDVVVYDCFAGTVRFVEKKWRKYCVEIIDAVTCYPCQRPMPAGQRMWFHKNEITDDDCYRESFREKMKKKIEAKKYGGFDDEDLPF